MSQINCLFSIIFCTIICVCGLYLHYCTNKILIPKYCVKVNKPRLVLMYPSLRIVLLHPIHVQEASMVVTVCAEKIFMPPMESALLVLFP